MESLNRNEPVRLASPILSGLLHAFIMMAACAMLISLFFFITGSKEDSLSIAAYGIHAVALGWGGFAAGRKAGSKGWYAGGAAGTIYSLTVFLVGFLGFDLGFSMQMIFFIAASFLVAAAGGMIGVNTAK